MNDLHREEHLQNLTYETRMAAKSEEDKAKADALKEKTISIKEMKHREKQARAWKKISYATKPFNHLGIVRLGIPRGFSTSDIKRMWDYLQQPNINPEWTYVTDIALIESILVEWKYLHYS